MARMTIGNFARAAGVGVETVRYYQRRGLLPVPAALRTAYREYDAELLRRLKFIRRVQADGACWLSGTTWRGQAAMRISVSNWSTTEADVDRSAAAIRRAAELPD